MTSRKQQIFTLTRILILDANSIGGSRIVQAYEIVRSNPRAAGNRRYFKKLAKQWADNNLPAYTIKVEHIPNDAEYPQYC